MKLMDVIRTSGGGEIVRTLAATAGLDQDRTEAALATLLPEIRRAIERAGTSRSGAAAIHAELHDERYQRYLERPATLAEPAAVEDGERALNEVLDEAGRSELVRRVAAATPADEGEVRRLLPQVSALAVAALGQQLREPPPSPEIPRFGTRQEDHFDAPLLKALSALFGDDDDQGPQRR